jgi:hypothetical protein
MVPLRQAFAQTLVTFEIALDRIEAVDKRQGSVTRSTEYPATCGRKPQAFSCKEVSLMSQPLWGI